MTIDVTEEELTRFAPKMDAGYRQAFLDGREVLAKHGILDNGKRLSHFFGQFGGETDGGRIKRESLYYTTVRAIRGAWSARAKPYSDAWITAHLLKQPLQLGDWAYGGRMGNRRGTSDGYDYRGGGMLQTTGRANVEEYCTKCGLEVRHDILDDFSATLLFACREWLDSGCNQLADNDNILGISKAINTGSATSGIVPNGMENRRAWFARARTIWWNKQPAPAPVEAPPEPIAVPPDHAVDETPPLVPEGPPPPLVPEPVQVAPATPPVAPQMVPPAVQVAPETADEAPGQSWVSARNFSELNDLIAQGSRTAATIKQGKDAAVGIGFASLPFAGSKSGLIIVGLVLAIAVGGYFLCKRAEKFFVAAKREGRYDPNKQVH